MLRPAMTRMRTRRQGTGHPRALCLRPAKILQPFLGRLRPPVFLLGPPETALPVARCPAKRSPAPASWVTGRVGRLTAAPCPARIPPHLATPIAPDSHRGRPPGAPADLAPDAITIGKKKRVKWPSPGA